MTDRINYWTDLEANCPIDISRIVVYAKEFKTKIPDKITLDNLNKSKEGALNSRSCLDLMIISLLQILHDREILEKKEDQALFFLLVDNLGRFTKRLDESEEHLMISFDEPNEKESRVGISRISAYVKTLKTASESLIYETLLKSTLEYNSLDKKKQEKRTFLYILFQVIQVTLLVLGGLTREKTGLKKGTIVTQSPNWQFLMSQRGQEQISQEYQDQTGVKLEEFDFDVDLNKGEENDIEEN